MTPDHSLWPHIVILAIALAPLVWMARQYQKEWGAYRTGTLIPRGYRPPEPPTLHQPWRWRFLWLYAAQAAAIGGLMWLSFFAGPRPPEPIPPQAYFVVFICWVAVVAFATAVLTRLWDRATALVRGNGAARQRQ